MVLDRIEINDGCHAKLQIKRACSIIQLKVISVSLFLYIHTYIHTYIYNVHSGQAQRLKSEALVVARWHVYQTQMTL